MATFTSPVYVRIRDREKVIFAGAVTSMTSTNRVGTFDILPQHANFITLVNQQLTLRTVGGKEEEIAVESGVLRVMGNKVQVFVGL